MKILALDIGGTHIKACYSDEYGKLSNHKVYNTESKRGGEYLVQQILDIIGEYKVFDAIGISTAGQVNSKEGYIVYANENIADYTGTRLKDIIEKEYNVEVKVENDVNTAALGEKYFGAGKEDGDFLCLTYGTGIGGAIVIDSKIYKGSDGIAAEFGHIITHPEGSKNASIRQMYYETHASTTALVQKALTISKEYTNGKIIFNEFTNGNPQIVNLIKEWVYEISLGLVTLIHIFNPPKIIIGGGIMEQELLVNMIEEQVKSMVIDSFKNVEICKASLGNKAGLLGAASLHIYNL